MSWSSWWTRGICALPGLALIVGAVAVVIQGVQVEDPASATPTTDTSRPLMVALGDSFISGEGATRYLKGTGSRDNTCHRANTAYPYLVAKALNYQLVSAACSGAITDHMSTLGQHANSPDDVLGGTRQLDVLDGSASFGDASEIDVVVLSIGGNDAGFGDVVRTCLGEQHCQRHDMAWMRRLEGIAPKLKATYDAVAAKVPHARRIVMTYPQIMVPINCAPGLKPDEIRWVNNRFLPRLAGIITFYADTAGFEVVDNTNAFRGARVCEDGELTHGRAANVFSLEQVQGKFALDPGAISRGSFHPSEIGHQLLAAQLLHQLTTVTASPEPCGPTCPPMPPPLPLLPPPGVVNPFPEGSDCEGDHVGNSNLVDVAEGDRSIQLTAAPGSLYCFREWDDAWRSGRADHTDVEISTDAIRRGRAISIEVLTQGQTGEWTRTLVIPAATDSFGKAPLLERSLFWILLAVSGCLVLAALPWVVWWRQRRTLGGT